jgi:hypothetical protein
MTISLVRQLVRRVEEELAIRPFVILPRSKNVEPIESSQKGEDVRFDLFQHGARAKKSLNGGREEYESTLTVCGQVFKRSDMDAFGH